MAGEPTETPQVPKGFEELVEAKPVKKENLREALAKAAEKLGGRVTRTDSDNGGEK